MTIKRPWWRRKGPITCRDIGNVLQSYLDREVTSADADEVLAHLDACVDCGLEAAIYDRIKAALAQPSHVAPDPAALARLRQFVDQLAPND